MKKADMLEEVLCKLGLMLDKNDKNEFYNRVIDLLKGEVIDYSGVGMYLTGEKAFYLYRYEGIFAEELPLVVPFGDGFLSTVAARGEISCEFEPNNQLLYIPFYDGHFLKGELIIRSSQYVDVDELKFLKYIQELLCKVPN